MQTDIVGLQGSLQYVDVDVFYKVSMQSTVALVSREKLPPGNSLFFFGMSLWTISGSR